MPHDEHRLQELRRVAANLHQIENDLEPAELDALAAWAHGPIGAIDELHRLAPKIIAGDRAAGEILEKSLARHAASHGGLSMRRRLRRSNLDIPIPDRFPNPCPSPLPGKVGDIAVAITVATPSNLERRSIMLDQLLDLSFCGTSFEAIDRALDEGRFEDVRTRLHHLRGEAGALRGDIGSLRRDFGALRGDIGAPRDATTPVDRVSYTPIPDGPVGGEPFPSPFPRPCPVPIPDPCDLERDFCLDELIDNFRGPSPMPDGSHVTATGITSVTGGRCAGQTIRINGSSFGATQPANIRVVVPVRHNGAVRCQEATVISWSEKRIEVEAPADITSGCVGFLDLDELERQKDLARRANQRNRDLSDLAACLRMGPISVVIPMPSAFDCPPCSGSNAIQGGPPTIQTFRGAARRGSNTVDGGWGGTTTIEPGDDFTLHWQVTNASKIVITRTSADGPGFGAGNSATDPPGTSRPMGTAGHSSPEVWIYEMVASNSCGTDKATVVVAATKDPQISFGSVEVTQGIQTVPPTVTLVADKPTIVRVFWNHGLGGFDGGVARGVTGTLSVTSGSGNFLGTLHPINGTLPPSAIAGTTIDVPANPQRANTDDSLNFLIPAAWCRNSITLRANATLTDYGAAPGKPGSGIGSSDTQLVGTFSFVERNTISMEFVRVRWRGTDGVRRTPSAADCRVTIRNGMQRVPAPVGTLTEHPDSPLTPGGTHNDALMTGILDDWEDRHRCEIRDAIAATANVPSWILPCLNWTPGVIEHFGEAYWALITGNFYAGRAADIPATTFATPARTVTDRADWSASNLDTKAGHEITHCLDQLHIELCGAPGGDDAGELSNGSLLQDVAFEIAINSTVVGATDIMSYCFPRWTHEERWARVFGYVGG